jgi:hypothetical protein
MNLFQQIKQSTGARGGNYVKPGFNGTVEITKIETFTTRKNFDAFVVNFKVISKTDTKTDHEVGEHLSYYTDTSKEQKIYADNVRSFLNGLFGQETADEMTEEDFAEMTGSDQTAAGMLVGLETYSKDTKAGKPFTNYKWHEIK